ncbi:MAG: glycosyltransferase family 9 protein [Gemmatimonadetes bacterium]|nr:glycosyltransferase family 9 protein [Gemmatimonadota bacterium]
MTHPIQPQPDGHPWINPIGGFGDMLMVSGVLKQLVERQPGARFHMVRRSTYTEFFSQHPAIESIGFAPRGAPLARVDYWSMEKLGPGNQRPYQILARGFGLATPIEERLYLPQGELRDPLLHDLIPWGRVNVVIAPASDSPRKMAPFPFWHALTDRLHADGAFVMQVGRFRDVHVRNAYRLTGLTTPGQLAALLRRCDLVITVDNFLMHLAHLLNLPAIVLWGPTRHEIYGYPEQTHFQARRPCGLEGLEECLYSKEKSSADHPYGTRCDQRPPCTELLSLAEVHEAARQRY